MKRIFYPVTASHAVGIIAFCTLVLFLSDDRTAGVVFLVMLGLFIGAGIYQSFIDPRYKNKGRRG